MLSARPRGGCAALKRTPGRPLRLDSAPRAIVLHVQRRPMDANETLFEVAPLDAARHDEREHVRGTLQHRLAPTLVRSAETALKRVRLANIERDAAFSGNPEARLFLASPEAVF